MSVQDKESNQQKQQQQILGVMQSLPGGRLEQATLKEQVGTESCQNLGKGLARQAESEFSRNRSPEKVKLSSH